MREIPLMGIFVASFIGSLGLTLFLYSKGFLLKSVYGNFGAFVFFFGLTIALTGTMVKVNEGREEVITGTEARMRGLGLAGIGGVLYLVMWFLFGGPF